MEKEKQPSKLRNKILKIITFQNPPFSPGRDPHKLRSESRVKPHGGSSRGFSGPMIPDEARRKPNESAEPTSPKISCMGQIKHKKMQMKKSRSLSVALSSHMRSEAVNDSTHSSAASSSTAGAVVKRQGSSSRFQRMLMFNKPPKAPAKSGGGSAAVGDEEANKSAPPLGEMRPFASGRVDYARSDWKARIEPDEVEGRDCLTDETRRRAAEEAFSGPILGGFQSNLQTRQEINLWKRRTTAQPRPLQLKPVLTAK